MKSARYQCFQKTYAHHKGKEKNFLLLVKVLIPAIFLYAENLKSRKSYVQFLNLQCGSMQRNHQVKRYQVSQVRQKIKK